MKRIIKLTIVVASLTKPFKGEQIINFSVRIGGVQDISLMGLMNVMFVALFSFLKRIQLQPCEF